jgi:hypothetical protein
LLVLLVPVPGIARNVTASSAAIDRATLEALRARAAERGGVRVIVSVASAERGAETTPEIEAAKDRLTDRLRGPDVPMIESIEGTPYIVLELTPRGVELLATDPEVQSMQEDRPERAQ